MLGPGLLGKISPFPSSFSEADVRHLCGPTAFEQGDALQRAQHVLDPVIADNEVSADVQGTLRRVDNVDVRSSGGRLQSECTCRSGPFCRHAAALMLHWLRDDGSFEPDIESDEYGYGYEEESPQRAPETPTEQYARLLDADMVPHLREIARRRGVRVTARNKAELVERLAPALSSSQSVDAALANLTGEERLMLDAVDLMSVTGRAAVGPVAVAYRGLGGQEKIGTEESVTLEALMDLGLVVRDGKQAYAPPGYIVPAAVAARIVARPDLKHALEADAAAVQAVQKDESSAPGPGLIEMIQVVAYELLEVHVGTELRRIQQDQVRYVPTGWQRGSETERGASDKAAVLLEPLAPVLSDADMQHLAQRTGQSTALIDFTLQLMLAFGVAQVASDDQGYFLAVDEYGLQSLLSQTPAQRLALLSQAWLLLPDASDFREIAGEAGPLQLSYRTTYAPAAQFPRSAAVRRLVAQILGRLAAYEEQWYSARLLVDLVWKIAPAFLSGETRASQLSWWLLERKHGARVNLSVEAEWRRVHQMLVDAMLSGPLTWLGMIDVAQTLDETLLFRVRPEAAVLSGRPLEDRLTTGTPGVRPLSVDVDTRSCAPIVTVPSGMADDMIHTLLSSIGELAEASMEGLRYRLTRERLRAAFEDGMNGAQLIALFENRAPGRFSAAARALLADWWAGFGTVRLYDDLTLVELADEYLLPELLATTSLREALVHTFSPRLIVVDAGRVDDLIAEMARIGHAPRVVEG